MQAKLDNLYKEYLNNILSQKEIVDMIDNDELSSPHLIDVSAKRGNYPNSEFKIVFVGKETSGWFNDKERKETGLFPINGQKDKYLNELKNVYKRINLGETYVSPIYLFIELLMEKIYHKEKVGKLLTNLLRHDAHQGAVSNEWAMKLAYDNNYILRNEIEILKPNALIFLTGPNYDKYIRHTYPDMQFIKYKEYSERQVSILKGIPNIEKAIRIYHPDRHKYEGEIFRHEMVDTIIEALAV